MAEAVSSKKRKHDWKFVVRSKNLSHALFLLSCRWKWGSPAASFSNKWRITVKHRQVFRSSSMFDLLADPIAISHCAMDKGRSTTQLWLSVCQKIGHIFVFEHPQTVWSCSFIGRAFCYRFRICQGISQWNPQFTDRMSTRCIQESLGSPSWRQESVVSKP